MFIGRQRELAELNRRYNEGKFQCVAVSGCRRVGKTALVSQFVKGKETIFFVGQETNARDNLEGFSRSFFAMFDKNAASSPIFGDFGEALEAVFNLAQGRRVILVIDQFNYLADSYKRFLPTLQNFIDRYGQDSKLFILLCDSSTEIEFAMARFVLAPFNFAETTEYFDGAGYSVEDIGFLYDITGGVPFYLSLFDRGLSAEDNVKRLFLTPGGYLLEEPGNLIRREFREPAQYNAILRAIACGASRLTEISDRVGMVSGLCSSYISKLIALGIVKKELPFGEGNSRKTAYVVDDALFRFWYRYIPDIMGLIQRGESDLAYGNFCLPKSVL